MLEETSEDTSVPGSVPMSGSPARAARAGRRLAKVARRLGVLDWIAIALLAAGLALTAAGALAAH
jgi:hypothetical protein